MSYSVELPVHINTVFGYFCDGCNMSELTIETECLSSDFEDSFMVHTLSCENYKKCKELAHRIQRIQNMKKRKEE